MAVDPRLQRLYVTTAGNRGPEHVRIFASATGATLRDIVVGQPGAFLTSTLLAMDGSHGRAVVAVTNFKNGGTDPTALLLLDARSAAVLRTTALPFDDRVLSLTVAGAARRVFVSGDDYLVLGRGQQGTVVMADEDTGAILRTMPLGFAPRVLGVDERRGHVFASNGDNNLAMYDARTGALLRTTVVKGPISGAVVDEGLGRIVVTSDSFAAGVGHVSLFDTATDLLTRRVDVALSSTVVALDRRTDRVFLSSVGGIEPRGETPDPGTVTALDARTGVVLRVTKVGRRPAATAVDERAGRVFIANERSGSVAVFDSRSGALLRTVATGPSPSAVAADERSGRVFVVNAGRLVPNRRYPDMGPPELAVGAGSVSVLDARTGAVLRTVDLREGIPATVAVDEQAGRAFVGIDHLSTPGATGGIAVLDATH